MSQFRARVYFLMILLAIGACTVIFRLFYIQVIKYKEYSTVAISQSHQRRILQAKRGDILDRSGRILVTSIDSKTSGNAPLPTNSTVPSVKRMYPYSEIAGPVLGYIGKDGYGLGGIEYAYDQYLRGEDGWTMVQKDGRNRKYRKIGMPFKDPIPGNDIYLTIDLNIQKIAYTVLEQTVTNLHARGGMCIVMEPYTGNILAMANYPSFDPNMPSKYSLDQRTNQCIHYIYEPGSTFKVITASVALQEKIKQENDILFGNNGVFEIYNQKIRDHDPYGYITFRQALAYSSNVCFAKIANDIGNERLYRYARDFGIGTKTGIELPGEESGILHPIKSWSGRSRVTMAIGQEVSVTLLQMMLPFAAIANGGLLVVPRVVRKIENHEDEIVDSTKVVPVRRVLHEDVAIRMRSMLQSVVDEGTGKNAFIESITVGGKTGTSQKIDSGSYSQTRNWSSFIGFIPVKNPMLLCGVVIDEPASNEMGGVAAAPAFKKIMTQIISHPQLEYAGLILNDSVQYSKNSQKSMPQLCGLSRKNAMKLMDSIKIPYKIEGEGDTILNQTPSQGTALSQTVTTILFADSKYIPKKGHLIAPDCTGKDLRDAINVMNLKGLKTFTIGAGFVKRQLPIPGAAIRPSEICTLYCSFEG